MPKLVILSESMKDRSFDLKHERITIGRLPDNIICLDDSTVSSHHAMLIRAGDDYVLRDLVTMNGTFLNGRRVEESPLCHGDTISFGSLQLEYLTGPKGGNRPVSTNLVNLSDTTPSAIPVMARERRPSVVATFGRKKKNRALKIFIALLILAIAIIVACMVFASAGRPTP